MNVIASMILNVVISIVFHIAFVLSPIGIKVIIGTQPKLNFKNVVAKVGLNVSESKPHLFLKNLKSAEEKEKINQLYNL